MSQPIVEVSVVDAELITNDVPATTVPLVKAEATVTVPRAWQVSITMLEAVMAVVETVTVPATKTAVPAEALVPVIMFILLPALSVRPPASINAPPVFISSPSPVPALSIFRVAPVVPAFVERNQIRGELVLTALLLT